MPMRELGSCMQALPDPATQFEQMLPTIRRVANYSFRHAPCWRRDELVDDVIALAYIAFARLVDRGKALLAYPTVLAKYAIRRIRDGRQAGCRQNVRDVLSLRAQRRNRFAIQTLRLQGADGEWQDLVIEDRRSSPADVASFRLDFAAWLQRLQPRPRAIVLHLAAGNVPTEAAQQFGVSQARISQVRKQLQGDWHAFREGPVFV